MQDTIPGTVIPYHESGGDMFSVIAPVLTAAGGLTLSQICELTGLTTSTVQNWIKRGWVATPRGRRYGEVQLARILLINLLRGSMQLEQIVSLMTYINGEVEDCSDDIIPDKQLYNLLCAVISGLDQTSLFGRDHILKAASDVSAGFPCSSDTAAEKLRHTLYVMALAYVSSLFMRRAQKEFEKIILGVD